jgi:hypothetical protein
MNQTFSMNNLEAVFTFPFKDRQWIQKLGLACLLMTVGSFILPIIPTLFVVGYVARIQRRIIKDKSVPFLPAWDDWGQYLSDGFKLTVAGLIWQSTSFLAYGPPSWMPPTSPSQSAITYSCRLASSSLPG